MFITNNIVSLNVSRLTPAGQLRPVVSWDYAKCSSHRNLCRNVWACA